MPRRRLVLLTTALLLLPFAALACEDDDDGEELPRTETPAALSPTAVLEQPPPVQDVDEEFTDATDGTLEVTIQDALFVANKLRVPFGQSATIDVTNRDTLVHNLRIAGFDGQYQTEDDAVTDPDPIPGGGSGTLSFSPAVPGAYTFRCDYHPGTMGGQVVVE